MRVHEVPTKDIVPSWQYCQDAQCPEEHHRFRPFFGVHPAILNKWDGVKH